MILFPAALVFSNCSFFFAFPRPERGFFSFSSHRIGFFPLFLCEEKRESALGSALRLFTPLMSISKAMERFDAVCCILAAEDATTRQMVPEVQALVALYAIDMSEAQTFEDLLSDAAAIGHTRLVKTGMLSLDPAMQQQVKWAAAETSLCHGHLSLAQWLHASFHLSAADVRSNNNRAVQSVCENGHLGVLQYMHTAFQLTREDARSHNNYALRWACYHGNLAVVQYLHTAFELTREDARTSDNFALRWACHMGHFDVIEYLHTAFQLTSDDARTCSNDELRWACENGHIGVARHLCTQC
jgi:hypothetical protein